MATGPGDERGSKATFGCERRDCRENRGPQPDWERRPAQGPKLRQPGGDFSGPPAGRNGMGPNQSDGLYRHARFGGGGTEGPGSGGEAGSPEQHDQRSSPFGVAGSWGRTQWRRAATGEV